MTEPDSTPKDMSQPHDAPQEQPTPQQSAPESSPEASPLQEPQGESAPAPAGDTTGETVAESSAQETTAQATSAQETTAQEASAPETPAPETPARPRIRIGSQRFSEDLARPKPQPLAPPKAERTAEASPAAPTDQGTADAAASSETAASGEGEPGRERREGGRRGRKFDKKDRPRPTAPLKAQRTTPLPSVRGPLSEELEQELEAALGDMSLEEIVAAETAAAQAAPAAAEPSSAKGREQGQIVAIHNEDVFVELGTRRQGMLPLNQFEEPPQVGDRVEVIVTRGENEDGLLQLSLPNKAMEVGGDWSALSEGTVVMAHVTGHNKGGLECQVSNIRGFIPASQASLYHVEDLSTLVGEKFACLITECNPERKNLVLSRRAVLKQEQEEAKQAAFSSLQPGQVREGVVRKIMDFGAFVDLGSGVDGLLHVSRLSWGRVNHPKDVLKEGDTVRVQIENVDPESERISLSMRDLLENPWDLAPNKYPAGTVVRGTVTRTMDFGAFVELEPGVEGLIHVSELAPHRVSRVSLFVKPGQEVEAKVLSVDSQAKRISLSMKALQAVPEDPRPTQEEEPEDEAAPATPKKKRTQPLKGGVGRASGGETFGLKW